MTNLKEFGPAPPELSFPCHAKSSCISTYSFFLTEIQSLFKTFDKNNDKYLSKEELGKAMRILGLDVTRGDVLEAMKVLDKNGMYNVILHLPHSFVYSL